MSPPGTSSTSPSPRYGARAASIAACSSARCTTTTRRTSGSASAVRTDQATTGQSPERQQHLVDLGAQPRTRRRRRPPPRRRRARTWSVTRGRGAKPGQHSSRCRNTPKHAVNTRDLPSPGLAKGVSDEPDGGVAPGLPGGRARGRARRERPGARSRRWPSSGPPTTRSTRSATTTPSTGPRCSPRASSAPATACRSSASPRHRHAFDLRTGRCLDDEHVSVPTYEVRVVEGVVLVGRRREAQAERAVTAPRGA